VRKIKVGLIGAGSRGKDVYGEYALRHPHEIEFVAVADSDEQRRIEFAKAHKITKDFQFSTWNDLLSKPRFCDAVIIATQDRMHYDPTISAIEKGYHVLLEKPMSNDPKECALMARKADEHNRLLVICHVLRYTPFFSKLKEIIEVGKIGRVISIHHSEDVGYWHQAHSFVRGNWRNSQESSPMILAKSCHDLDILSWLVGKKCVKIASFGSLSYFKKENAPEGSTERCSDGCIVESSCPYSALKIYLGKEGWPSNVVSADTSSEGIVKALATGQYGKCVFRCDNDVVDHQIVNMEFENGVTAAFTMCAFTKNMTRKIKIMGTNGEIHGDIEKNIIEISEFSSGNQETIRLQSPEGFHSGGDDGLMRDFIKQVISDGRAVSLTSAETSMQSHLMAFAAEKSRLVNKVIFMDEFEKEITSDF
jgi:predicted dehydrogenase